MAQRPDNLIEALKKSIIENHDCSAIHLQSVLVEETVQVEVFEIQGHAKAKTAYGWWNESSKTGELVTILALTLTQDAGKAVQAWRMSQSEPS